MNTQYEADVIRLFRKLESDTKMLTLTDEYVLTIEGRQVVGLDNIYRYLAPIISDQGLNRLLRKVA